MLSSFKLKLPFAQWLLVALVSINLIGGVALILNTARIEGAAIEQGRIERLEKTIDELQTSVGSSLSNFGLDRRREILAVVSPVIYANPELDLMGLYRLNGGWGLKAWTRAGGEDSLKNLFPEEVILQLVGAETLQLQYENYFLVARPVYQTNQQTGQADVAAFLVVGQDLSANSAELIARIKNLAFQLILVVLLQTLVVAFFLDRKLRRPIQRITNGTALVEQENADFASEFSNLNDLERIEKAVGLLGRSRAEYRQQEAYLRSILETMKEGILVLDCDANIVEVNQAFVSTWGYTLDDIKGQPIQTIFHPRHRPRYEEEINNLKATGEAASPDVVEILDAVDMNGREFPITYIYSEFSFGNEQMFVVNVSDISEQERQKEELVEAKETADRARQSAEQAAAAKAVFLANMSHEIRTPMNGVMGLLDLVGDTDLDSQQAAMIRTAKVSAESLLNVLNDILDISKIEAGKIDLESTEFELDAVVEEVVTLFHVAALDKGLELSCYIDPALNCRVMGDPTRMRQVMSNIIGNAVKFTQEGEVEVRLEVQPRGSKLIDIAITVRDTGIGMSDEAMKSLFDPFSQADSSTTRKFGGTGLGMAISRQLVKLMKGRIEVDSEPGVGTTFRLVGTMYVSHREGATYKDRAQLPATNVLVVDDNATNREIMAAYLSNWNIDCSVAEDAAKAMEILSKSTKAPFDICLMDYHMPEVDGIDLARKINSADCAPDMVLALLSSGSPESKVLKEVGITQSLNKPIRQTELFDLIARCREVNVVSETVPPVTEVKDNFKGLVLVVEDNKVNQLVAQSLLEKIGLDVDLAVDGEKGLDAMLETEYDLVLMDCLMPIMDGYEATRKRREYEVSNGLERTPIIALTANAMSGDREKCLEVGMDDFLSKPIKVDEMKEKLRFWLGSEEEQLESDLGQAQLEVQAN